MKKQLLCVGVLLASVFGFTSTINAQDAVTANPYAYALSSEFSAENESLTVKYSLNAPAVAVSIDVYNGEELVKSFPVEAADLTVGEHSILVPTTELPKGAELTWKVKVTGAELTAPAIVTSEVYSFWSPYGITVDNNPQSKYFGRVLVTETQMNIPASGYHTSTGAGGIGSGLYAFDPQMQPIKNANGGYGFTGGLTFPADGLYPGGSRLYGFKRLATTEDGRVFVSNANMTNSPLLEIDPSDLNANFTPVFVGTPGEDGIFANDTYSFIAGPNVTFTTKGKGEDLTIMAMSCKNGWEFAYGNYYTDVYKLGTAKTWDKEPTEAFDGLTQQYTISPQTVNICYDKDGGVWYVQYRATPTEAQPAIKHFNAAGVEDYSDITTIARGGGIAYNMDKSLLAIPTASGVIGFFTESKDADGKPVLTKKFDTGDISTTFRGQNAMAFDYAGNLYTCDNGKEKFGRIAMPREDVNAVTPAMADYNFTIPVPVVDPEVPESVDEPTLTAIWTSKDVPAWADNRQGVLKDGKWYVQNKAEQKIDVWTRNGKEEGASIASGAGTNICTDDAGNIIVRKGTFPNAFANGTEELLVIPAAGGEPVAVTLNGMPLGRCDFFGHASGNVLSEDGGKLYITTGDASANQSVFVVTLVNGAQDADNCFSAAVDGLSADTATAIYSFTAADGEEHVIVARRGTATTYFDATWNGEELVAKPLQLPSKYSLNGCAAFVMGGKNYIVYPTSTVKKYLDGFAVAEYSTDAENKELVKFEETYAAQANGIQCDWFGVEVVSDTRANIYQFYPGGQFAMYVFQMPEPQVTEPTLKQDWVSTNVPAWGDNRQAIVKDGKWYVQNKADQKIDVWTKDGKEEGSSIASGAGTDICTDDAGNIIVRKGTFPNAFANGTEELLVIPAAGGEPVAVTLNGMPLGRCDFFGHASGNVLSEDGGKLYITTGDASAKQSVFVVTLVNGAQDADNCFSAAVDGLSADTSTAIYSFAAADGEEHVIVARRGTATTYFDATWNGEELVAKPLQLPSKYSLNGCAAFVMGGKNYIVYPTSTAKKYLDGFSIAEYSTDASNAEIVKFEETYAAQANGIQCDWFSVEVVNDTKAYIYQYYPGGHFARYTFQVPPTVNNFPEKIYAIGNIENVGWDPSNGTVVLEKTSVDGVYEATFNVIEGDATGQPGIAWIGFSKTLGATNADWDTFNSGRFGSTNQNELLEKNVAKEFKLLGDKTYTVSAPATITVKADLNAETITITDVVSVVDDVTGSVVKVIASVGQIDVIGDVKTVEVYTAGGALVSKGETTVSCSAGLYIVKVNGKAVKVVVK